MLLSLILVRIRSCGDTPLCFDVDAAGIARDAWAQFTAAGGPVPEWPAMASALDRLVEELLPCAGLQTGAVKTWRQTRPAASRAAWVHRFQAALRRADPQCAAIAGLLVEGYPERDAARRMGIGVQLLRRITTEFHAAATASPSPP